MDLTPVAATDPRIEDLIVEALPRDLLLAVEDALDVGAKRAFLGSAGMNAGHRASALGHLRHFHMNETFADALAAAGANPSKVRGNQLVIGRMGMFNIGRLNITKGPWYHARRSKKRLDLCRINRDIEQLIQPSVFEPAGPVTSATLLFVAVFSGSLTHQPEHPISIDVAVPDSELREWLFTEPLSAFVRRYDVATIQPDNVQPVLKPGAKKKNSNDDDTGEKG